MDYSSSKDPGLMQIIYPFWESPDEHKNNLRPEDSQDFLARYFLQAIARLESQKIASKDFYPRVARQLQFLRFSNVNPNN